MILSVITICLNDKNGLINTIKSVIAQSTRDFEFIIIDGGSTDGSVEVIEQYKDYINYWISEPDNGVYNAMNKGIQVARGEYCIFLNANDEFFDSQVVAKFIAENPQEDILSGSEVRCNKHTVDSVIKAPEDIDLLFFMKYSLTHQSTFIRTENLRAMPYDESYKIQSDFIFFFRSFFEREASYKKLHFIVSNFQTGGISTTQYDLMNKEREHFFYSFFSSRTKNSLSFYASYHTLLSDIQRRNFRGRIILGVWKLLNFLSKMGLIIKEKIEREKLNKLKRR